MNLLFEPFSIKNLTLPNRFVRSATYDGMAEKNGRVSSGQIRMVEELAKGGVGLIILGIAYVQASGQISPVQNSLRLSKFNGRRRLYSRLPEPG